MNPKLRGKAVPALQLDTIEDEFCAPPWTHDSADVRPHTLPSSPADTDCVLPQAASSWDLLTCSSRCQNHSLTSAGAFQATCIVHALLHAMPLIELQCPEE